MLNSINQATFLTQERPKSRRRKKKKQRNYDGMRPYRFRLSELLKSKIQIGQEFDKNTRDAGRVRVRGGGKKRCDYN